MDQVLREKRKNPQESASILSLLFFGWTAPIFLKGVKRNLEIRDLYDPLESDESERLGNRLEREWKKELMKVEEDLKLKKDAKKIPIRKPSLKWAIVRTFWVSYMVQGLFTLFQSVVLVTMQPVIQGWVIGYFDPSKNQITRNEALLYSFFLTMVILGIIFITRHTIMENQRTGMCVRVACCSLIYRKVLRLNQGAVNNTAAGQVANLISNDVARFDSAAPFLHYIWIMPIQVTVIGYVMWKSVGVATLVGIGTMLMQTIPVQGYLSRVSAKLRFKIARKTDERVQMMSELISGIQVVKMYSWEKRFEFIVSKVRELEMKLISYASYLRGVYQSMMVFSERVTLYLTLITYVLMGNSLTAEVTFTLASLFNMLQFVCALGFPQGILLANVASVSVGRITEFLLLDEIKCEEKMETGSCKGQQNVEKQRTVQQIEQGVGLEVVKVAANWIYGQLPSTLCGISLEVKSSSLCAIVGPVGSGKSSLLHLLLGELPVGSGKLSFFTGENSRTRITRRDIRISYTSQDPWLFSASIRDNILFSQPFDEERYREVTRVCALLKDFEQLPQGDLTFVGERGASLSGGQRARVNLARAVYRDADLYLLDDPLSAVDAHVGRHLFEQCITGFLKDKTRILVTHQLQYLRQADSVIVLNCGIVEHQGTYEELAKSVFHVLDSVESEDPDEIKSAEQTHEEDTKRKEFSMENSEGFKDVIEEEIAMGEMSSKVYAGYFLSGGNLCLLLFFTTAFLITGQISASGTDYWVKYWTDQETLRVTLDGNKFGGENTSYWNNTEGYQDRPTYFAGFQWYDEYGLVSQHLAIYVYTFCVVGCIFFVSMRNVIFMRICMNASRKIHDSMFANLLQATMRFFNTNPSGRVLTRFSKDIGTMDESLPYQMLEALQTCSIIIGVLIMVGIANNYMIIPMLVAVVILYFLRKYYLKTAQTIKRLEGVEKSPVLSHVSSTLDGLTTIRSLGNDAERLLRREFDSHQDAHSGAWYLTIATAHGFGLFLDLISCFFITCVCFSFILMDDETPGGSVGLAISQSLILVRSVQHGMKYTTQVISEMTSVERVLQYTKLPKEGPFTTEDPPPQSWPSKGRLVFKNVTMRYADNKPPVLKDLNLSINPGWKVGIVGRTGAGKSSLISALFALTGDGLEGEIVLDGIDTKSIGLHELRPCISIIPQEPILFTASLRHNLDPFEQYSDAELWDSLREVELGDAVPSLDFRVAGGGANFSVGQRQLICLARAMLRNNRVLVLDEATANVDLRTDGLIQNTIRRRFADCTVLTIAHRLNTIMDSDRVLVMTEGRVVEFGDPHLLLQNRDGFFSQMVQQTGKSMAEKLAEIAKSAFLLRPECEKELKLNDLITVSIHQSTYL